MYYYYYGGPFVLIFFFIFFWALVAQRRRNRARAIALARARNTRLVAAPQAVVVTASAVPVVGTTTCGAGTMAAMPAAPVVQTATTYGAAYPDFRHPKPTGAAGAAAVAMPVAQVVAAQAVPMAAAAVPPPAANMV